MPHGPARLPAPEWMCPHLLGQVALHLCTGAAAWLMQLCVLCGGAVEVRGENELAKLPAATAGAVALLSVQSAYCG